MFQPIVVSSVDDRDVSVTPSVSSASASSVAVRRDVPLSSSEPMRLARPDLPGGSSAVPAGSSNSIDTMGSVFHSANQTSMPFDSVFWTNRGAWNGRSGAGPGIFDQSTPGAGGRTATIAGAAVAGCQVRPGFRRPAPRVVGQWPLRSR